MKDVCRVNRQLSPGQYCLADVFTDIRSYNILKTIFERNEELDLVLTQTRIFLADHNYEMFVNDEDASIVIGLPHLRTASDEILYLDIIHELCHVWQYRQGRDLYDESRSYVDRDTEIEAYLVTIREARRIGLSEEAIADYLRVSWITPQEHQRLVLRLNVSVDGKKDSSDF
jgi:hypothetical protein